MQKARTDTERFITAAVNVAFTTLVGIIFVIIYAWNVHWAVSCPTLAGVICVSALCRLLE